MLLTKEAFFVWTIDYLINDLGDGSALLNVLPLGGALLNDLIFLYRY